MTTLVYTRRFLTEYVRNPVNLLLLVVVPAVFVGTVATTMADAAKLLGGHPLLQRFVALAISIFGRQGRRDAITRHLALEGSFEGGQQPPAAVQILQRLVAPDCRTDVTDRAVGAQRVVDGHVLSDADSRRRADWHRRVFMRMRMSRGANHNYHSNFSILRTTTWVSRVKIPVGPQ